MGFVISIYTKLAFKEYMMPSIQNSDYTITLRSNYFQLKEDVQVELEVLKGKWRIKNSLKYTGVEKEGRLLENNAVVTLYTNNGEEISIIAKETEANFHVYKKYSLRDVAAVSIGKEHTNTICYDYLGMVSRNHARIARTENGYKIENQSVNGVYVNAMKIEQSIELNFGDFINILGLHIVFLGDILAIDTADNGVIVRNELLHEYEFEEEQTRLLEPQKRISTGPILYHRAPRNYEKLVRNQIEIEEVPEKKSTKKQSTILTLGPSLTMVFPMLLGYAFMGYANKLEGNGNGSNLYMYSGLIMIVGSALFAVLWAVLNLRAQIKEEKEDEKFRFKAYSEYLVDKKNEVETVYNDTIRKLEETYPSASACLNYNENMGMLWNRNYTHDDFLRHRLGVGELPFQCEIAVPKKRFKLQKDNLAEQPELIKENFQTLYNVPITLDLITKKLIGIVGEKTKRNAIDIARLLSLQIGANNCYTDVKMVYIYDNETSDDNGQWEFAKWFPHTWSEDKNTRYVAASKEDMVEVFYELSKVMRNREEEENKQDSRIAKPYYVMFVSDVSLLEGQSFDKYIFSGEPCYGLTTILLTDSHEKLPNDCEFIIENSENFSGMYDVYQGKMERQKIKFDALDIDELNEFSRHLSALHVPETEEGGELPNSITFFDMYQINRIEEYPVKEMWAKCKTYENIKGMLGQRANGVPCYLDVHEKYHGPHGLVAGTTGSGKSETLQTYILSLAINYSPDDVGFFIIDYKGGGMANLFDGLPHMIGQISNLSGNQVKRAMISIKSENRRRQRVFSENGVNNINLYTKLYKNGEAHLPIPHLFIIIDEFAELKREEPDFMKELISVAQVGRSLGVHLILATQKPSGTVDDNIWSNSKFRLCLRVQDKQDSRDMLHKDDAAFITQAGRGYLQVGNDELYELFQSGFSGAIFDENMVVTTKDVAKMISMPGKVEMTGNSVKQSQKLHAEVLWVTQLCRCMDEVFQQISKENAEQPSDTESKTLHIVELMYQVLERFKIEYPVSDFNTARLKEFVGLYGEVVGTVEKEALPLQILNRSVSKGVKLPQAKEKTQLDVTKQYLKKVAVENGYTHDMQLWMPLLKEQIYLDEFEEFRNMAYRDGQWKKPIGEAKLEIVVGKADDPENQNQMAVTYDFLNKGHLVIAGSIVSGKSTTVQTIMYSLIQKYSPEYVNMYAIDFSSKLTMAFEKAPHVGGIMYEDDFEKISKFVTMMETIMEQRKAAFRGGNYKQYLQMHGPEFPAIIVFIDNYAAFKEKTEELYENFVIRLSKEGASLGIYLVVTGASYGFADITARVGENIENALCLQLQEKFSYVEFLHTPQIDIMPEAGIKGRGITVVEDRILEYQVALALEAENDYQRMERIEDVCEDMLEAWDGECARKIPEIPEKPVWSQFIQQAEQYQKLEKDKLPIGYDKNSANVYSLSLKDFFCYLVCGFGRTGKTNFMRVMIQSALLKDSQICIVDSPKRELKLFANEEKVTYLTEEAEITAYVKEQLLPTFAKRNNKKWDMIDADYEEEQIYEKMQEETPIFMFIGDLDWFTELIYTAEDDISGILENLTEKGILHNIYFVAEIAMDKITNVMGYQLYSNFVSYETGIHFGGRLGENDVLPFGYVPYNEQGVKDSVGVGSIPGDSGYTGVKKVVLPMARK